MNLDQSEFLIGFAHRLFTKTAEELEQSQVINAGIFPTVDRQISWKYAKTPNQPRLSDGNIVHTFDLEDGFKDNEAFRLTKIQDTPYFEFNKDSLKSGTAQVHKANPGMLYVTMHDGAKNTTLTLSHVSENSWRAVPKMKKTAFDFFKSLDSVGNSLADGVRSLGHSPAKSALLGGAVGAGYDFAKRRFYNTKEENDNESLLTRLGRIAAPAAAGGLTGYAQREIFPDYYKYSPVFNSTNPASHIPNYVPGKTE